MSAVIDTVKRCNPNAEYVSGKGTFYRQKWTAPAAPDNVSVHAAITLPASGTTVTTTGIVNPPVARVVRIKGNQVTVTGNVVIVGLDQFGVSKTDTIASNGTSTVDGVIAFKSITSITVPTRGAGGDTISVGVGQALGLERRIADPISLGATYNGVVEGTAPTLSVTRNTVSLNTTLAGADVVVLFSHIDTQHL